MIQIKQRFKMNKNGREPAQINCAPDLGGQVLVAPIVITPPAGSGILVQDEQINTTPVEQNPDAGGGEIPANKGILWNMIAPNAEGSWIVEFQCQTDGFKVVDGQVQVDVS